MVSMRNKNSVLDQFNKQIADNKAFWANEKVCNERAKALIAAEKAVREAK